MVGASQPQWHRWERDVAVPRADELKRIVAASGGVLSAEALVEGAVDLREAG